MTTGARALGDLSAKRPARASRDGWVAAACAVVALPLALSALGSGFVATQADELTLGLAASRLAQGEIPYRDYFAFLPPGGLALIAVWLRTFGVTLVALRAGQLLVTCAISTLLFGNLRLRGAGRGLAAMSAILFPALFFAYWPVPSHHHLAALFGLAALLVAGAPPVADEVGPSSRRLLVAGVLLGFSVLTLLPEGALTGVMLVAESPFRRRGARRFGLLAMGAAAPIAVAIVLLAAAGALGAAFRQIVLWPISFYRQAGGFNDTTLWASLVRRLGHRLGGPGDPPEVLRKCTFVLACAVVAWSAVSAGLAALFRGRRRDWPALLAFASLVVLYLSGRRDWVHLLFWMPFLLVLGVPGSLRDGMPRRAAAGGRFLLGAAVAASAGCWLHYWVGHPPSPNAIVEADRVLRRYGPLMLLDQVPDRERRPTAVYLPHGAALYFVYDAPRPPVELVMPPSSRLNPPWDYQVIADWCTREHAEYVILGKPWADKFLEEPSPLRDVLTNDYATLANTKWGRVLARKAERPVVQSPSKT